LEAVTSGAGLTTTIVLAVLLQLVALVTVSIYVPAIDTVAVFDTMGLCRFDTNPPGPVHEYETIPAGAPLSISGAPLQTGPLFEATATGGAFTATVVVAVPGHPLLLVTVRV